MAKRANNNTGEPHRQMAHGPACKYDPFTHLNVVEAMAKMGATQAQMADALDISTRTLIMWLAADAKERWSWLSTRGLYTTGPVHPHGLCTRPYTLHSDCTHTSTPRPVHHGLYTWSVHAALLRSALVCSDRLRQCPLSGVKRTSRGQALMSASDPKRTSGCPFQTTRAGCYPAFS
jgi:hypothetical protein